MNRKAIIVVASFGVIVVVVSALLVSEFQNPKIFCYAQEFGTSNWYRGNEHTRSPVLAATNHGASNFSSLPDVDLGVEILNNNSRTLFNVALEVCYRTPEDKWNTTVKTDIGFLDVQQFKHTRITLTNPYLSLWHTKRQIYDSTTTWINVTVYFLNASDYKITAYGFAKP